MTFALVLTGLRWQGRQGGAESGIATVAAGNLIACVAALPMALPLHNFTARDAAVILYLGAAQVGLAYWCLTGLCATCPPSKPPRCCRWNPP